MAVSPASSTFYYPGIYVHEESLTRGLSFKKILINLKLRFRRNFTTASGPYAARQVMKAPYVLSVAKRVV
jgi:hypothetical protein